MGAAWNACAAWKTAYYKFISKTPVPWKLEESVIFHRLDMFVDRCRDSMEMLETVSQFGYLQSIEIGGHRTTTLTPALRQVYDEFSKLFASIQTTSYDILDIEAKRFDDDFYVIRNGVRVLEKRVASLACAALSDASGGIDGVLSCLLSIKPLIQRELVWADMEQDIIDVVRFCSKSLDRLKEEYKGVIGDGTSLNIPAAFTFTGPELGALVWSNCMKKQLKTTKSLVSCL